MLSLPHVFYYGLWHYPKAWIDAVSRPGDSTVERGNTACKVMANAAHALKIVQAVGFIVWILRYAPEVLTMRYGTSLLLTQPGSVALGLALIGLGQTFNVAVYQAIGKNGVYYGNRFGAELGPWCTGFPFNVPVVGRHPQYFGVLSTMWGIVILIATKPAIAAGLVQMTAVWTCFYVVTSVMEQTEDAERKDK